MSTIQNNAGILLGASVEVDLQVHARIFRTLRPICTCRLIVAVQYTVII
jgi:hypothetical protein